MKISKVFIFVAVILLGACADDSNIKSNVASAHGDVQVIVLEDGTKIYCNVRRKTGTHFKSMRCVDERKRLAEQEEAQRFFQNMNSTGF